MTQYQLGSSTSPSQTLVVTNYPSITNIAITAPSSPQVPQSPLNCVFNFNNTGGGDGVVTFTLKNTMKTTGPGGASDKPHLNYDVYRLSVSVEAKGWTAQLINGLAAVEADGSSQVTVYVSPLDGAGTTVRFFFALDEP